MSVAQFVDISAWQPQAIDWHAYKEWSKQGDGISRVALRSSYGTGFKDNNFEAYRQGALSVNIDQIFYYHYSYPQFNTAQQEADYQRLVVGNIRPSDMIVLDFEENVPASTSQYAFDFLSRQEQAYKQKPAIYSYYSFIMSKLQDARLAQFNLWYANWQYNPNEKPPCPPPWKEYAMLQYTDRANNIPGIPASNIDADVYLLPKSIDFTPQFTMHGEVVNGSDGRMWAKFLVPQQTLLSPKEQGGIFPAGTTYGPGEQGRYWAYLPDGSQKLLWR